jgi:hypothetical protein
MGNATSVQWGWEVKDGRMQPRPMTAAAKRRPLFKKQASDDYNWWIGNPAPRPGGSGDLSRRLSKSRSSGRSKAKK